MRWSLVRSGEGGGPPDPHCGQTKWPRKKAIAKTTKRIWESMKRTTPTQKPMPIFCSKFIGSGTYRKVQPEFVPLGTRSVPKMGHGHDRVQGHRPAQQVAREPAGGDRRGGVQGVRRALLRPGDGHRSGR